MRISDWSSDVCSSDLSRWIFVHFGLIASDGMLRPVVSERFPTGRMIASVRGDAPVTNICIKPFFAQSAGELQGHVEALLQSRFLLIGVQCRLGGKTADRRVGKACGSQWSIRWTTFKYTKD